MALFSDEARRRIMPGVTPYFPTADEPVAAVPGGGRAITAPRGIFGAPPAAHTAAPTVEKTLPGVAPMGNAPEASFGGDLQQASVDYADLARPVDMSNVRVKRGFNDPGGTGDILRSIAATLAAMGGNQAGANAIWSTIAQRREAEAQRQRQEAQRFADRQEWTWREQWKRDHPDDQFTQYLAAAGIDPRSPQGQALYRQRAESMAAPPLMAVDGFDAQGNPTKTFMPRAGFGGTGAQTVTAGPPIGTVKNGYRFQGGNPNDRNSWVPAGGASPAGGATFR